MRLTNRMMTDSTIDNITKNLEKLYRLQEQSSSQQKYLRPSDNPAETTQIMDLNSTLRQMDTYQNALATTQTWMSSTEHALTNLSDAFVQAKTAVLKGLSDTLGADERKVLATEIDGIINGMVETVNSQDNGRYIFSGLKTEAKPFEILKSTVNVSELWVNVKAEMNITGTPPTMTVNGVIMEPAETSSGSGIYLLSPTTVPASPLPGITIQADTNSSPTAFTVNGNPVEIVSGKSGITTNVKVDIPVNSTDFPSYQKDTVSFNGDSNILQRFIAPNELMNVSINGGAFGLTPYTDNSGGTPVTMQTSELFNTLIRVRDVLNNADYLTPHTLTLGSSSYTPLENTTGVSATSTTLEPPDKTLLQEAYGMLQQASNDVSLQMTYTGARMKQVTNAIDRNDKASLEIKSLISQKGEVNLAEAITEAQNQSTVYQVILNISGRTNTTMTLFDTMK